MSWIRPLKTMLIENLQLCTKLIHLELQACSYDYFLDSVQYMGDSGISRSWASKTQSSVLQHLQKHASTFGLDVSSVNSTTTCSGGNVEKTEDKIKYLRKHLEK
ncbi:hypothetical protein OUZ56_022761 [Daphnia magna]|uniref:Uncharacterized protein n=1 Tax=Daphnia magna TaxID=35525 RepID=A0ABR0AXE2_9CRUS|nr:hypothetical protein OUZ56_022761 [Daphnia magna]